MANTGRCISKSISSVTLLTEQGTTTYQLSDTEALAIGDWLEVRDGAGYVLTPNRTADRTLHWTSRVLDPRRMRGMEIRSKVEACIRNFFSAQDFREVRTPLLVPSPGMEPHIRPFKISDSPNDPKPQKFLPTSPEFAMKKLLTGGLERIFQITPAFRDEPKSLTHSPEFTMLEWYRAMATYGDIMKDTEELFAFTAQELFNKTTILYQGRKIALTPPWPRLKIRDLFLEHAGVDLVKCHSQEAMSAECLRLGLRTNENHESSHESSHESWDESWDDLYFKIWLNIIEPKLPRNQAVFVTRYPESQAALSVLDRDPDGSVWAKRFEVYLGGMELGNAFEELTDPLEQRRRFKHDMELRARTYGSSFPESPIDEDFMLALTEGMPPAAGIAMGVDRMVMLMADETDIDYTFWM